MARKDPKVGTGKKPKGTGRRLYTDENPKDTVRIKYATVADARATARKVKNITCGDDIIINKSQGILNRSIHVGRGSHMKNIIKFS